jgi:hypothetical protein
MGGFFRPQLRGFSVFAENQVTTTPDYTTVLKRSSNRQLFSKVGQLTLKNEIYGEPVPLKTLAEPCMSKITKCM